MVVTKTELIYRTPEYKAWISMRARCTNPRHPQYKDYGGRGIKICSRWSLYENFLADLGKRPSTAHTLERMDNSKGYEPGNCKWATRKEQSNNRRNTVRVVYEGKEYALGDLAEVVNVPYQTLHKLSKRYTDLTHRINNHKRNPGNGFRLTIEQVKEIKRLLWFHTCRDVATLTNTSLDCVESIQAQRTYSLVSEFD